MCWHTPHSTFRGCTLRFLRRSDVHKKSGRVFSLSCRDVPQLLHSCATVCNCVGIDRSPASQVFFTMRPPSCRCANFPLPWSRIHNRTNLCRPHGFRVFGWPFSDALRSTGGSPFVRLPPVKLHVSHRASVTLSVCARPLSADLQARHGLGEALSPLRSREDRRAIMPP